MRFQRGLITAALLEDLFRQGLQGFCHRDITAMLLLASALVGAPLKFPRASLLPVGQQLSLYELYEDRAVHGPDQHVHHAGTMPVKLVQYDPESYPGIACEVRSL